MCYINAVRFLKAFTSSITKLNCEISTGHLHRPYSNTSKWHLSYLVTPGYQPYYPFKKYLFLYHFAQCLQPFFFNSNSDQSEILFFMLPWCQSYGEAENCHLAVHCWLQIVRLVRSKELMWIKVCKLHFTGCAQEVTAYQLTWQLCRSTHSITLTANSYSNV